MNIDEAIDTYIKWKFLKYKRAAENYASYLKKFSKWLEENTEKTKINEIDEIDAGKFQNYLEDKNYAQSTIHYFMIALRDLIKYFYLRKETDFNFQLIQIPRPIARYYRQAVKTEQVDQICAIIGENLLQELRDKLIINFLFTSGVRVSELVGLNAKEIDITKQSISIPNKKHPNGYRVICWDDETHRLLMLWLEKRDLLSRDDSLFMSFNGIYRYKRISVRTVQRLVKKHAIRAGIKNADMISPHCYRHGFCKTALNSGIRLDEAQQLMGHTFIGSTKKYLSWENTELEKSYKEKFNRNPVHNLELTPEKEDANIILELIRNSMNS
ncbi:MAG: tyrosine-type recombinase/integrase [Candidatus Pacebacteria bacterium]|nr:tyrosine-type recombinase/integrase [Candidatus Paceibacterota bacterium]